MSLTTLLHPPKPTIELLIDALGEQYEDAANSAQAHAAAERFDRQSEAIRAALLEITGAHNRVDAATTMVRIIKALRDRSRDMHAEVSALRCTELGDDCTCALCRRRAANPV